MTVDDLKRRYDYGYWANQRMFGVIAQLTTAEFTQSVAGGWGSIRNTLVHTMSAEWDGSIGAEVPRAGLR